MTKVTTFLSRLIHEYHTIIKMLLRSFFRPSIRAFSATAAPAAGTAAASSAGQTKKKPAKIKTFKIWRYDPDQPNQKPRLVDL